MNHARGGFGLMVHFLIGLILAYLIAGALLYVFQNTFIFPGGRDVWCTPADEPQGWPYEDLWWDVMGHKTNAWFVPTDQPWRGVILDSHGNAGTMADRIGTIGLFRELGFDVLIYDYGGYGKSTGNVSEERCYADARAAWRWLTEERGVPPERIVLFGRSLGGGPAIQLATEVAPAALIVESTFLSIARVAESGFPYRLWPVRWFIRHPFDNEAKIGGVTAPVLVVHSPDDDIIAYRHGRALYELAPAPKAVLDITGDHNYGWEDSGAQYVDGLRDFLWPLLPAGERARRDTMEAAG